MAIVIPNVAELELLRKMLRFSNEDFQLRLFQPGHTVSSTTTLANLTSLEVTFTGYSAIAFTRANWLDPPTTVSGKAEIEYNTVLSWTVGATGDSVDGYFVTNSGGTTLLWAENFDVTRVLVTSDILRITPKFTFESLN